MFSAFGTLALLIAGIGMYGVFSAAVTRRRHELAVRMALGAGARDILELVVAAALRSVVAGVLVGGAVALWAGRHIEHLLYETEPSDPLVLSTVAALLLGAALLASLMPAARAARTEPRTTLGSL